MQFNRFAHSSTAPNLVKWSLLLDVHKASGGPPRAFILYVWVYLDIEHV